MTLPIAHPPSAKTINPNAAWCDRCGSDDCSCTEDELDNGGPTHQASPSNVIPFPSPARKLP